MKLISITFIVLVLAALTYPAYSMLKEHYVEAAPGHQQSEHPQHEEHGEGGHHADHLILVTSPVAKDVVSTQSYVCQLHSRRHIELCALEGGYLQEIAMNEGQSVKKGDILFRILPVLYQAKLDADVAEAQMVQVEYNNTEKLLKQNIVSQQELSLVKAKLAKAHANVKLAQAELDFANVKAPFDGIVDRQLEQLGSLIEEGDALTTLSDNQVMWAYFNVPESRYFEYKTAMDDDDDDDDRQEPNLSIELKLANHKIFSQPGTIGAIEADFNNETGNIAFRADFPNPKGLLRHGQTGTVLIHRVLNNAIVIPQRATFEILAKRYAYVVGDDGIVEQREIIIQSETDDIFVIEDGLEAGEKIVLEGIRQVRDGDKVEYEFRDPAEVLDIDNLKNPAE